MANEISVFEKEEFGKVRVVNRNIQNGGNYINQALIAVDIPAICNALIKHVAHGSSLIGGYCLL